MGPLLLWGCDSVWKWAEMGVSLEESTLKTVQNHVVVSNWLGVTG